MPLITYKDHYRPVLSHDSYRGLIEELKDENQESEMKRFEAIEYKTNLIKNILRDIQSQKLEFITVNQEVTIPFDQWIQTDLLDHVSENSIEVIQKSVRVLSRSLRFCFDFLDQAAVPQQRKDIWQTLGFALEKSMNTQFSEYESAKKNIASKQKQKDENIMALRAQMAADLNQQLFTAIGNSLARHTTGILSRMKTASFFKGDNKKKSVHPDFHLAVEAFLAQYVNYKNEPTAEFENLRKIMEAHTANIAIIKRGSLEELIAMMESAGVKKQALPASAQSPIPPSASSIAAVSPQLPVEEAKQKADTCKPYTDEINKISVDFKLCKSENDVERHLTELLQQVEQIERQCKATFYDSVTNTFMGAVVQKKQAIYAAATKSSNPTASGSGEPKKSSSPLPQPSIAPAMPLELKKEIGQESLKSRLEKALLNEHLERKNKQILAHCLKIVMKINDKDQKFEVSKGSLSPHYKTPETPIPGGVAKMLHKINKIVTCVEGRSKKGPKEYLPTKYQEILDIANQKKGGWGASLFNRSAGTTDFYKQVAKLELSSKSSQVAAQR